MADATILAASHAADALQALLLHATELSGFGDVDAVGHLAEALANAIDVRISFNVEQCDVSYRQDLEELKVACQQYLEAYGG